LRKAETVAHDNLLHDNAAHNSAASSTAHDIAVHDYAPYDFDTLVDRSNCGNMKGIETPRSLTEQGFITFQGAEMDFRTAPVIMEAIRKMADRGLYGFTWQDEPYNSSVRWWMKNVRNWEVPSEAILPTLGTIFALGTAVRAFTEPGDGVIVQEPVYYRYDMIVGRNGRVVVNNPLIERDGYYTMDFEDLDRKMADPRNKLFVLCNPHNPIGRVWDRGDLSRIAELANRHGVKVFSDEIFAEVTFDGHEAVPYSSIPGAECHGVVCTSLGKAFNFTGVNHANVIILNESLRDRYNTRRKADHFGSIDPFFYASLRAAYSQDGLDWLSSMKDYVYQNYTLIRDYFKDRLPILRVSPLEGTFTIWIDFRGLGMDDESLKRFLEEEALLYVDAGNQYGEAGKGFCRMNIASPRAYITKSLDKFWAACQERERRMR